MQKFLSSTGVEEREKYAYKIFLITLKKHEKEQPFYNILKYAGNIERGVQVFNPSLRDHLSHSVYTYLLGISLISTIGQYREIENLPFEWKMASLLHDIGNPVYLLNYSINEYFHGINSNISLPIIPKISFNNLSSLMVRPASSNSSFTLIRRRLKDMKINIDIKTEFNNQLKMNQLDHGILGSLIILKVIDELYAKNNPNHYVSKNLLTEAKKGWARVHFEKEIINVVSIISIHNIIEKFEINVDYNSNPLLFLLLISDALQEWDRFSPGARVYDPFSVKIKFETNILKITLNLPEYKRREITNIMEKLSINNNKIECN